LCRPALIHLHPTNNAEDAVVFSLHVGEAFQHKQPAAPLAKVALQSPLRSARLMEVTKNDDEAVFTTTDRHYENLLHVRSVEIEVGFDYGEQVYS
jgi:hypothetical protein